MPRTREVGTSQEELLGTTTGIIVIVVVAVAGLAVLIVPVFGPPVSPIPGAHGRGS